jgi:hypothetical protein
LRRDQKRRHFEKTTKKIRDLDARNAAKSKLPPLKKPRARKIPPAGNQEERETPFQRRIRRKAEKEERDDDAAATKEFNKWFKPPKRKISYEAFSRKVAKANEGKSRSSFVGHALISDTDEILTDGSIYLD